jgi:glycosyltransferase involved in cell wall biosynthesis
MTGKRKIKIFHLITTLNTGGAEMMLYKLLSRWDRNRFSGFVVSLIPPGPVGALIEKTGTPVVHLNLAPGKVSPRALWHLIRLIRSYKPDILQTWLYHADLIGLIAGKTAGVSRVVWNIRSSKMEFGNYRWTSGWTVRLCRLLSRFPDLVITNSHVARTHHMEFGYQPRRFIVIPNGFDLERFRYSQTNRESVRRELKISNDIFCVGLIARFDPKKDHLTFLEALVEIKKKYGNIMALCCGDGITANNIELNQKVTALGLGGNIKLLGRRDDIDRVMSAMDIVALSSAYGEGFPNVLGEAMACEIVCVTTDTGDSGRIVGNTGKVVPPRNVTVLTDAMDDLLSLSAAERREMGRKARQRIQKHYSLGTIVQQYERLYWKVGASG